MLRWILLDCGADGVGTSRIAQDIERHAETAGDVDVLRLLEETPLHALTSWVDNTWAIEHRNRFLIARFKLTQQHLVDSIRIDV